MIMHSKLDFLLLALARAYFKLQVHVSERTMHGNVTFCFLESIIAVVN